jgi:signal transduction histidine kinase
MDPAGFDAFLSTAPARPRERRIAYAAAVLSVLGFCLAVPFARAQLASFPAFIALYQSALFLNDLITAVLLFGQLSHVHSRALMVLAGGYIFNALMIIPHTLTFPGLFAPTGLLGAGEQSTAWLYMFWHGGFPLFVIAYALLRNNPQADRLTGPAGRGVLLSLGCIAVVVCGLTLAATAGQAALPPIMAGDGYTPEMKFVVGAVWLLSLVAIVFLYPSRRRSVLDLWLVVVLCAWVFDIALSAMLNHGRYDLGFYAGRVYGLLASGFVLVVLLFETSRLYSRYQRSQERLREAQKMEVIGQLTGGVAHDFNNLLTVVMGNLDLLARTEPVNDRQRKFIGAAQRGAARCAQLTEQLLAFGRRQTLRPESVNINELVRSFESLLRRALGESIEIVVRPDPYIWPCLIDPAQFESALLNLAINARDAMPAGGTLTIETKRFERPNAESDGEWKPGSYVTIVVTDTGAGMSREVVDRAFEPFFTTKEIGKGSGLGLSQVYGFVKQSGGHATLSSAPGKGTTVTLYLPKAQAHSVGQRPVDDQPGAAPAARGEVILVVEDDDDVRRGVADMVDTLGYAAVTACSGMEAVGILRRNQRIDLVLSDIVMPGMSGVELAIEAARLRKGIKVLLMSGYPQEVLAAKGADGHFPVLAKPYREKDLAEEIRRALSS